MHYIKIQEDPINFSDLYQKLIDPKFGGIDVFIGTVRQWTNDIETSKIEYSAYIDMAMKELNKLAIEIENKGVNVVIVHRLGLLSLTEASVFVGVAASHRDEAFKWCRYLIDELKKNVPIWKKEFNDHGIDWGGIQTSAN